MLGKVYGPEQLKAQLADKDQRQDRVHDALLVFNKDVEQGKSNQEIAEKYSITPDAVQNFRKPAFDFYIKSGFQDYANCYSYAMNDHDRYSREVV